MERERERQETICHGIRNWKLGWGIHRIPTSSYWGRVPADIPDPALIVPTVLLTYYELFSNALSLCLLN